MFPSESRCEQFSTRQTPAIRERTLVLSVELFILLESDLSSTGSHFVLPIKELKPAVTLVVQHLSAI